MVIKTKFLNHPVTTLGYRFEYEGKAICTLFDHEPFRNMFPSDPEDPDYDAAVAEEGETVAEEENARIRAFFQDADIVVHDTQYTLEVYTSKFTGWGHTSYEHAIKAAHRGRVKRLLFFHHDPLRTDDQLDELLTGYRKKIGDQSSMEIDIAREGMTIEV